MGRIIKIQKKPKKITLHASDAPEQPQGAVKFESIHFLKDQLVEIDEMLNQAFLKKEPKENSDKV